MPTKKSSATATHAIHAAVWRGCITRGAFIGASFYIIAMLVNRSLVADMPMHPLAAYLVGALLGIVIGGIVGIFVGYVALGVLTLMIILLKRLTGAMRLDHMRRPLTLTGAGVVGIITFVVMSAWVGVHLLTVGIGIAAVIGGFDILNQYYAHLAFSDEPHNAKSPS